MRIDEKTNVNGLLENNAVGFFYISHFLKSTFNLLAICYSKRVVCHIIYFEAALFFFSNEESF